MTSRVFRRLGRLELRNAPARGITPIPIRVLLVDAEKGVTGVLLLDGAKPTMNVPAHGRGGSLDPRGFGASRGSEKIANDISSYQPAVEDFQIATTP
jgi:hypothetical protein